MSSTFVSRSLIVFGTALTIAACSDANGPEVVTREQLSGSSYTTIVPKTGFATGTLMFTTTENGVSIDRAARGAEIRLTLNGDGTTTGSLVVPDVEGESGELETFTADLTGTWRLDGNVVHLDHPADTFLRDMPLRANGFVLEADETFGDVRVRVVLIRQ